MEAVYTYYKPAWKSFYKAFFLMLLIVILAFVGQLWGPEWLSANAKWLWIAVAIVDFLIFIYIAIKRVTMMLILKDNPDKPEDQEVAFVVCHPLKPFSPDFRESIEIGLANIMHIKVGQNLMQTLFNIGDVIVTSSGTATEEIRAYNLPSPKVVRDEIQKHARRYTMPTPPSQPAAPAQEAEQSQA